MRPVRAAAAQPQIDARNMTLTVGVQAETRITPKETKPDCPFPAKLELVPPMQNGKLAVGVPIDVPFTALDKVLEAQLKGQRYPEDNSAPVEIEVRSVPSRRRRRPPAGLARRQGARAARDGSASAPTADGADLGQAGARREEPGAAPHRSVAGGGIGSRLRPARRRRARRHALSAEGAGRQARRSTSSRSPPTPKEDRRRARRIREERNGVRVDTAVDDLRLTGIAFDSQHCA